MLSWSPGAFLTRGSSLPLECCLTNCVPVRRLTSDLLQAAGFSTRHFGIWSLAVWKKFWRRNNRRNNMAFDQAGGWKNICWQRTFYWIKLPQLESQCGLSIWAGQRHLTAYIGQHCEKLYKTRTRGSRTLSVVIKWSMVNACTPQGEPILGTGGEKKYIHWCRMQFQISLKWSEVKPVCPQAAREGHRWKQKRYVHINALQMVLFMIRRKRIRTVASDLPTGSHPLPRPSSCPIVDTCKSSVT